MKILLRERLYRGGLVEGLVEARYGQGVFVPDVDEPFRRPDGPGPNDHAFDHGVRIRLEDAAVHEGPGVPLVAVADDVLPSAVR